MRKLKGFTLIELLIVVAIIGILATVIIINLTSAQSKAKDARLQSDLSQVSNAAEIYKSDAGGLPTAFVGTSTNAGTVLTDANVKSLTIDGTALIAAAPKHPVASKSIYLIADQKSTVATPPAIGPVLPTTAPTKYIVYGQSSVKSTEFLTFYTGKVSDVVGTEPRAAK